MKLIKFGNLCAFAFAITIAAVGCKTQHPNVIKFDEQGRPITGSGADQTAGNAGKLDTDSSIAKSADTTGIAMGNGHPGWGEEHEALKADTIHFEYDSATVKPAEHSKVSAVADYLKSNSANAV